jgi:hypothetical protein
MTPSHGEASEPLAMQMIEIFLRRPQRLLLATERGPSFGIPYSLMEAGLKIFLPQYTRSLKERIAPFGKLWKTTFGSRKSTCNMASPWSISPNFPTFGRGFQLFMTMKRHMIRSLGSLLRTIVTPRARHTTCNLRASQTPPCRPWCGSLGLPPNARFSLGLCYKIECGRWIGLSIGNEKIVKIASFATKFKNPRPT